MRNSGQRGFSLACACLTLLLVSTPVFPVSGSLGANGAQLGAYTVPMLVAMLAACLALGLGAGVRCRKTADRVSVVAYALSCVAFYIGGTGMPGAILGCVGVLAGLSAVGVFYLACVALARIGLEGNLHLVGVSLFLANLLAQAGQFAPPVILAGFRMVALLVGLALLVAVSCQGQKDAMLVPGTDRSVAFSSRLSATAAALRGMLPLLAIPLLGVFLYALLFRSGLGAGEGRPQFLGIDAELLGYLASAACLAAVGAVPHLRPLYGAVYKVAVPVCIIAILIVQSFPEGSPARAGEGFLFGFLTSFIVQFALCVALALIKGEESMPQLAALSFLAVYAVGRLCCFLLSGFESSLEGEHDMYQVIMTVVLSLMLLCVLLQYRASEGKPDREEHASLAGLFEQVCCRLSQECGLSPREADVFAMLARGYAPAYIAETLIVSDSTVRSHVKSIYRKLGVNSREELILRVDQEAGRG